MCLGRLRRTTTFLVRGPPLVSRVRRHHQAIRCRTATFGDPDVINTLSLLSDASQVFVSATPIKCKHMAPSRLVFIRTQAKPSSQPISSSASPGASSLASLRRGVDPGAKQPRLITRTHQLGCKSRTVPRLVPTWWFRFVKALALNLPHNEEIGRAHV